MQLFAGVLLLVYASIFLFPPGLIPHSEHDHLGQLDTAVETDPCHLAMYHPGVVGGCQHKYHISKNHGDCRLCHLTLVRHIVPDPICWIDPVNAVSVGKIDFVAQRLIRFSILHDDRGPPASSIA